MYCSVRTATVVGVEAIPVDVQVHIASGLPSFQIVGLPDVMVQESRERVRSALRSTGFSLPASKITVNLAPAALRKHGSGFDLPIALGVAVATGQLPAALIQGALAAGELGLDGAVMGVAGDLAFAALAVKQGRTLIAADCAEAAQLVGVACRDVHSLSDFRLGMFGDGAPPSAAIQLKGRTDVTGCLVRTRRSSAGDMSDVVGQDHAVRALTIAAVGRHNVLLIGPPGTGKTMLARRFVDLLPPMSPSEALETMLIHSVAGLQGSCSYGERPFRDPHHSTTTVGLVGGGNPPHPGEVSLAHNGVLFLDELPQFGPASLQSLRTPLEDGKVTVVRSEVQATYPASFWLIAAANPCPCGFHGDPVVECRCSPALVDRYLSRIGGPLLDRFDLVVRVERPNPAIVLRASDGRATGDLIDQVAGAVTRSIPAISDEARSCLERAASTAALSPRAMVRTLRVARSIARLTGADSVTSGEVLEALSFRGAP